MEGETAIEKSVREFVYSRIQESVFIDVSTSNTINIRSQAKHGSIALAMFWLRVLRHQNNYPMPNYPYKEVYDKKGTNKVILKVDSVSITTFMACGTLSMEGSWVLEWFLNTFPTIMDNYDLPVTNEPLTSRTVYSQYTESWKKLREQDKLTKAEEEEKKRLAEDKALEILVDRTLIITKADVEEKADDEEVEKSRTCEKLKEAASKYEEEVEEEMELLTIDTWPDEVLDKQLVKLQTCRVRDAGTYLYPLWKTLLHKWFADSDCKVTIATPYIDTKRMIDICNIVLENRITANLDAIYVQRHCDHNQMIYDIRKKALDHFEAKEQMYLEYKIYSNIVYPTKRLGATFIANVKEDVAEVLVTSASFHGDCFDRTSMDTVYFQKMSAVEFVAKFLAQINSSVFESD